MTRKHAGPILLALTAAGGLALGSSASAAAETCPPPKAAVRENPGSARPILAASLGVFTPRHKRVACGAERLDRVCPQRPACRENQENRVKRAADCGTDSGARAARAAADRCDDRGDGTNATATSGINEIAPAEPTAETGRAARVAPGEADIPARADSETPLKEDGSTRVVPLGGPRSPIEAAASLGGTASLGGRGPAGGTGPVGGAGPVGGTAPQGGQAAPVVAPPGTGGGMPVGNAPGQPGQQQPGQPGQPGGAPGGPGQQTAPGGPVDPGARTPDEENTPEEISTPPQAADPGDVGPFGRVSGVLPFTGAPAGIALAGAGLLAAGFGATMVSVRRRRSAAKQAGRP